ncbi:MAG: adenosylhomocysteinase [Candidatus Omnitrophota bacterium]|nr:adenosylhomocysteinase [Candidatus Omnitrophota bacterium]MBU1928850.1 adenosylhomocysteinase [Candidatus Omnitrophota bacterium]MBU2034460.1 adenosylhomocysteinase [Candidatus Omnitrophota bacterium]MBU2257693.1 adenosylhomocysteinase [Candidatus Omnitrophota bacterium]
MRHDIKDIKLAKKGALRIEWARNNMPVLRLLLERFHKGKPLKGVKISCCLHVTTETGVLAEVLKAGGAEVVVCASNPLSTQDDVAASLVKNLKIPVFAVKGEDTKTYYKHMQEVLALRPDITMDDGADLVSTIHQRPVSMHSNIIGGTEETTTGVIRLKALAKEGKLRYPIIAVNDALTKHLFDNRYGTGQSTIDGIIRATNKLVAGSNFVVCGYGWCGRGVAMRAKGMGANVYVIEISPLKALEAVMDGFQVMPIKDAARIGDIFVTVTGDINVIREEHFIIMKDGAIVCNSGHFNVEIEIPSLEKLARSKKTIRDFVVEYKLRNGRRVYLLGEGRLINLAAAEGHPAQVMDMSFANQALSAEYIKNSFRKLNKDVYTVPEDIDNNIAYLKLKSMGIKIDILTAQQKKYLSSWEIGT